MKKLLMSLGFLVLCAATSHLRADLFTTWAGKIRDDSVMKAMPKMELCYIKSYLEGKKDKFNDYIKGLQKLKGNEAKVTEFQALTEYIDQLNESDDEAEQGKVTRLLGIILARLNAKNWKCS